MLSIFRKRARDPAEPARSEPPSSSTFLAKEEISVPRYSERLPGWIFFPSAVLVVAILYWAQEVLVPIAIAVLLTFVLNPVVTALERLRLGRVPAVAISVVMAFSILLGVGWVVARQIAGLANELPQYRRNIREKVADLRSLKKGGALEKVEQTVEDVKTELKKPEAKGKEAPPREVVVAGEEQSTFWPIPLATGPVVERLAAGGLAVVLVIFMLIQREELRNRLIRILGYSRLTVTTKALEEAGQRISRYLFAQLLINSGFGLAVGTVLFFLGVPYALLWGFMATLLRFIPYIGPWAAALMPTVVSLAYFPGWITSFIVVGAFVAIELVINLLLEPRLYGESAGVSEIAILIMAAFWTWLWGPVGLMLATPLTVCLVVFAKYIPEMTFVTVMLSDAPAMEPYVNYYQRMLALDQDEAEEIVEDYIKSHDPAKIYDAVFIPALSRAKNDRRHGQLAERDEKAIYQGTRAVLEDLEDLKEELATVNKNDEPSKRETPLPAEIAHILGFPAENEADEIALLALAKLLESPRYEMQVVSADMLAAEMVSLVEEKQPALICIGAVAPGGLAHARYLCKRIRARCPDAKIVVGRWGFSGNIETARTSLTATGADRIATTLIESRDQISQLVQLERAEPSPRLRAG
jgi:predicted PurR-regulated permease PerM